MIGGSKIFLHFWPRNLIFFDLKNTWHFFKNWPTGWSNRIKYFSNFILVFKERLLNKYATLKVRRLSKIILSYQVRLISWKSDRNNHRYGPKVEVSPTVLDGFILKVPWASENLFKNILNQIFGVGAMYNTNFSRNSERDGLILYNIDIDGTAAVLKFWKNSPQKNITESIGPL